MPYSGQPHGGGRRCAEEGATLLISDLHERRLGEAAEKLEAMVENLASRGIDRNLLWDQCLPTPSCGTGSLSEVLAEEIFRTLWEVSELLRH